MMFASKNKSVELSLFDKLYLLFFIGLPFIYTNKLVDPVLLPRQIFLTIFIFLVGIVIFFQIKKKTVVADFSFFRLPVNVCFSALLLTIVMSFFYATVIQESMYLLSKIVMEFLFLLITTFLILQNKLNISSLIKSVVVFAAISVFMSFWQVFKLSVSDQGFLENVVYLSATFGIKNLLASVLFLTIPFLFNAFKFSKVWKIVSAIITVLSLLLIWLLQTKAVILSIIVFGFVFSLVVYLRQKKNIRHSVFKIAAVAAFIFISIIGVVTFQNRQKFYHLFDKKSSTERLFIWDNSVQMIKEHAVFGVGGGNWQINVPKYGLNNCPTPAIKEGIQTLQRPHNDFLWIFCEMGIIGFLAYAGIFISVLYHSVKLLKKHANDEYVWLYSTLFAGVIGYVMIAFVDFPLERIEHQVLLLTIFSMVTAGYYKNVQNLNRTPMLITAASFGLLLFVTVLFSATVSIKRSIGEFHSQKIYTNESKANWPRLIAEANNAINSFYVIDPMSAPIEWYKGVALFSQGNIDDARVSFEKAYSIHPYNMHVINNLASCYESVKDHEKAIKYYQMALHISSEFEEARLNLSAVYFNTQQFEKAFEIIDECHVNSKDPKYASFLPVILNAFIKTKLNEQQKEKLENKEPNSFKSMNALLVHLYFDAKAKNRKFDVHVLDSL